MPYYSVANWNEHFENSNTSKVKNSLSWVPIPTKHDGKSYKRLMRMEDGFEVYAAWILIVQVAAKCPVRGVLSDRDGGLTAEDLHFKTDAPINVFERALAILSSPEIGWLTRHDGEYPETSVRIRTCPETSGDIRTHPDVSGDGVSTEQNRTEQNRTEQNRTEQNRTEQNRIGQNIKSSVRTDQSADCPALTADSHPIRSDPEKPKSISVFDKIFEYPERLANPETMREWVTWQASQEHAVIPAPTEADVKRVLSVAHKALSKADNPAAFFAASIGKQRNTRGKK